MSTFIKTLTDFVGNQIIPRTRTSAVHLSDGSVLDAYEDNIRGGGGIRPQIVVTAPSGSVITCTDGTMTQTVVSDGHSTFYVPHFGTYTVSSVLDGDTSPIKTIFVDTVTIYQVTLAYFSASLVVTAPNGSTITCRNGTTVLTGISDGTAYTFTVKIPGSWVVTSESGENHATQVVSVQETGSTHNVSLDYYKVYGVRIDTTNSNPETSVSYIEGTDAAGMTKGSADWDALPVFNTIKPCTMLNGEVTNYLNPNNFAQTEDGQAIDITSATTGDVMIEFGKGGYKFVRNGNFLDIYVTNNPRASSDGYVYHPFSYSIEGDCDHFWVAAYATSGNASSLSGKNPNVNSSRGSFRNSAKLKGAGYELFHYFQFLWVQILYTIKYGNLNSQAALGRGYVSGSSARPTGTQNTAGMDSGDPTSDTANMKLFGLEDIYGNRNSHLDGLIVSENSIKANYPNYDGGFNDTGTNYRYSHDITSLTQGYIQSVMGVNEFGFIAKTAGTPASETTYYCDRCVLSAGGTRTAIIGGSYDTGFFSGIYHMDISQSVGTYGATVTARLSYCYSGK